MVEFTFHFSKHLEFLAKRHKKRRDIESTNANIHNKIKKRVQIRKLNATNIDLSFPDSFIFVTNETWNEIVSIIEKEFEHN